MIKSKKQMFIIIGVFTLILLLGTTTYAFFNYTRTGSSNTIKVGRISFVSENEQTISLTNLFPIDPEEQGIMNDSTKVGTYSIDIKGDTDYVDGIEYLVSAVDTNIYTNQGQIVPITLDFTVTDLGDPNVNYFVSREDKNANIYKKLVGDTLVGDQMLLVGYIKPNTTSGQALGVDGNITIKAYLDKNKILISDTYDGTESDNMGTTNSQANGKTVITTTEWNALQQNGISFKVKVEANEGIWVNGSFEEIMRKSAVMDNTTSTYVSGSNGIDFGAVSGEENGKGVYIRAGTENDPYPIMYYRGEIKDNNVLFANKCWKAVRTTDTGGVKLIYNGEKENVYEKEPLVQSQYDVQTNTDGTNTNVWTFDTSDNSWNASTTSNLELSFKVPAGDDYVFELIGKNGATGSGGFSLYKGIYSDNGGGGGPNYDFTVNHFYGTLTSDDVIKFSYSGGGFTTPTTFKIRMLGQGDIITDSGCGNNASNAQISLNINGTDTNSFAINSYTLSTAYVGYMYGTVYEHKATNWTVGAKFGSSFIWDGTSYKLVDASVTTPNSTHHYSCNQTDENATCNELRYVFYSGSSKYYITLTGGDGIEDAIRKIETNTNDSEIKDKIDTWFEANLTNIVNNTNKDYQSYLEDTIWCNDRSFGDNNNNGWIANGGDLSTNILYGAHERSNYASNNSTVKNQPSLACANKNDRFTVNNENGNKSLKYPVALLTEDELVLAGGVAGVESEFYLKSGRGGMDFWTMSPSEFRLQSAHFGLYPYNGYVASDLISNHMGLRPAISLKPGIPVVSGSGTSLDPYVIG